MSEQSSASNVGKLVEIKGVVLDAVFPERLPEIYTRSAHRGADRRRRLDAR